MQNESKIGLFIRDFVVTIRNYRNVLGFVKKHELWNGLTNYGWAMNFLILAGALLGLKLFSFFGDWFGQLSDQGISLSTMGSMMGNIVNEGYELFVMGGFKYVILIILEVVIFHFARKTLQVLTGMDQEATLKAFIDAQLRMIMVVIYCFIMETILTVAASTVLSIFDTEWMTPAVTLTIQCYFLGFAVIDNYNEIYKLTIKQSAKYTRIYAGVALAIGLVVYVLMLLPVIGTVLAPLLGAVVATLTMYELEQRDHKLAFAHGEEADFILPDDPEGAG